MNNFVTYNKWITAYKPVEVSIEVIEKWEKDAKDFAEALDTAEE
ncbi:712_t:CDS:2 [Entrophospora sp. SA101]|nr:712_t:CDS:2 [Entrophospora sp. SA101]